MTSEELPNGELSPNHLTRILEDAHWTKVGGRNGRYARYAPPTTFERGPTSLEPNAVEPTSGSQVDRQTVIVPLDPKASDYSDVLADSLRQLKRLWTQTELMSWIGLLSPNTSDQFLFSKQTEAPHGSIQWEEGEFLVTAARNILVAGAKTTREPLSYFGNRHGQFATRFLNEVMMGQTAIGSYVIRAYVPTDSLIPMHGGKAASEGIHFEGIDSVKSQDVSSTIVDTLAHTTEALEHYRLFAAESVVGLGASVAG